MLESAKIKQCRHRCTTASSSALEAGHAAAAATAWILARRVKVHACGALLSPLAAGPFSPSANMSLAQFSSWFSPR